uniref:Uncharacterized protein n=1 Tax=Anguilla anguilla TaxID=7936 RepID=A0A0E9VFM2_ANGAN
MITSLSLFVENLWGEGNTQGLHRRGASFLQPC